MAKKRFTKVIKKAKAKKVKKARHFNKNNNPDLLSRVQYRLNSIHHLLTHKKQHKKLRNRREYTQHDLEQAVRDVQSHKLTYEQASDKYDVPKSTILDGVKGRWQIKSIRPSN